LSTNCVVLELLSALRKKFEKVECELESSLDFTQPPYKLGISRVGSQLCMIPRSDCADLQAAIKKHMTDGGASLGIVQVSTIFVCKIVLERMIGHFNNFGKNSNVCKLFENRVVT
jgi:hypothetical protein